MTAHTETRIEYRGTDRRGVARTGSVSNSDEVPRFVRTAFNRGWQTLVIAHEGALLGSITRLDGRRIWWAQ